MIATFLIQLSKVTPVQKIIIFKGNNIFVRVLSSFTETLVSIVSLVVLVMLTAIALFLISNTISIGITVRDEEIKVMRLLGAHNAFIRAPFVVEGIIIGIAGALIPIGILYAVYGNIVKYILTKFSFLSNILSFMPVSQLFKVFVPMAVALSVGLGLLGSFLSLNRHLKEK